MNRIALCLLLAAGGLLLWNSVSRRQWAAAGAGTVERPVAASRAVAWQTNATADALRAMRQDLCWKKPAAEPEFAAFKSWADGYAANVQDTDVSEGVRLAQARRAALFDLMDKDPRRALELAVPEIVRRALPPAVQARLEERIDGRGDLLVTAAVALPGREAAARPVTRTVTVAGREFDAYTYGNRESAMSRGQLAIHGVAVGGRLALSEWAARILEPVEVRELRARECAPSSCPVSGMPVNENGDEVVLDFCQEEPRSYCQAEHAMQELHAAAAREAALPPGVAAEGIGGGADLPVPPGPYTHGTKKLLIIRVDFPDKRGQVVSDATLTTLIDDLASHWTSMSYGKTTWFKAGHGSAFTPTLRLPLGHANYTNFATMLGAARSAAEDAGYDYADFDFDIVVTGDKPDVSFGGMACVGARGAWLANGSWTLGSGSHELGHNFGLNHSGFWKTSAQTTIGAGSNEEYGNPFDHMGTGTGSAAAHFSARQKAFLGWIPEEDVRKVTADGTFPCRIAAFDEPAATGARTIAVDRAGTTQDYWIEYRAAYNSNNWMKDGVVINFGDANLNNGRPSLLDFTPGSASKEDCPLLIGKTFSDTAAGIHLTPTGRGIGPGAVPFIDVTVVRGTIGGNRKPAATLSFSPAHPAENAGADFTLTASDPDGDALACFWDWGDGTWTANNSPAASHSWTGPGFKLVRCIVSDMKGLATTATALLEVGTAGTWFLSGKVTTAAGSAIEGATVSAGGRSDSTDSEGFYTLTGLPAGSFDLAATKPGSVFLPDGFTNPVAVGTGRTGLNLVEAASAPEGAVPAVTCTCSGADVTLAWPLWAAGWTVQSSSDLSAWADEGAPPVPGATAFSVTMPRTAARKYFRLVLR